MTNYEYIDALIAKVLSGEAGSRETAELEEWKNSSGENMEYFKSLQKAYVQSLLAGSLKQFDTDAAWLKVKSGISKKPVQRSLTFPAYLRIAAMLVIMGGIGIAVFNFFSNNSNQKLAYDAAGKSREFYLPDSTNVFLNRNAKLDIVYSKTKRTVNLSGEAFFDIAPDADRPFEVLASGIVIKDIGTSFNVKTHGNDSVSVVVLTGEVRMIAGAGETLNIMKGEKGIYITKNNEFRKESSPDTNIISYKTKIFVFENASLEVVAQKLVEVYDIRVHLSEGIRNCRITATFRNENPGEIIQVVAETLKLNVSVNNEVFTLDGPSCEE